MLDIGAVGEYLRKNLQTCLRYYQLSDKLQLTLFNEPLDTRANLLPPDLAQEFLGLDAKVRGLSDYIVEWETQGGKNHLRAGFTPAFNEFAYVQGTFLLKQPPLFTLASLPNVLFKDGIESSLRVFDSEMPIDYLSELFGGVKSQSSEGVIKAPRGVFENRRLRLLEDLKSGYQLILCSDGVKVALERVEPLAENPWQLYRFGIKVSRDRANLLYKEVPKVLEILALEARTQGNPC